MKLLVLLTSLTLARAATTSDNNEHSLLRGAAAGSVDVTSSNQQHQHRSLDPGGADCVPHSSGDGTLVCTIRTQNNVYDANNYNYNRVLQDLCIPAGPAGPLPPPSPGIGVDFPMPEPSLGIGVDFPIPEPSLGMGSSGTQEQGGGSSCPKMQPLTYGHCSGWIPSGTSEISCQYGNVMCNCAGQDGDAIKIGWSCESLTLGNDGNVITTPIPNPTLIDATIDADVFSNSAVEDRLEPEPEPEPIRSEQVGITLASSPNCPASQPGNGSGCQFYTNSSKCPYQSADFPSGWLTCGCTKYEGWICQEYTLPAFSF